MIRCDVSTKWNSFSKRRPYISIRPMLVLLTLLCLLSPPVSAEPLFSSEALSFDEFFDAFQASIEYISTQTNQPLEQFDPSLSFSYQTGTYYTYTLGNGAFLHLNDHLFNKTVYTVSLYASYSDFSRDIPYFHALLMAFMPEENMEAKYQAAQSYLAQSQQRCEDVSNGMLHRCVREEYYYLSLSTLTADTISLLLSDYDGLAVAYDLE